MRQEGGRDRCGSPTTHLAAQRPRVTRQKSRRPSTPATKKRSPSVEGAPRGERRPSQVLRTRLLLPQEHHQERMDGLVWLLASVPQSWTHSSARPPHLLSLHLGATSTWKKNLIWRRSPSPSAPAVVLPQSALSKMSGEALRTVGHKAMIRVGTQEGPQGGLHTVQPP